METLLHLDDDAFVRAPAALVHRRLTDVARWPTWWRGVRVQPMADAGGREAWAVEMVRSRWHGLRFAARPFAHRPDVGHKLAVTGEVDGEIEFWLEEAMGGTIVHHLLNGHAAGSARSSLRTYRTVARWGLWGLKDALQTEVRTAVGMSP